MDETRDNLSMAEVKANGLRAYASQFRIPESEVRGRLGQLLGSGMADDSIIASGTAWADGPLTWRERSIAVISCMVALGGVDDRLASHLKWGLTNGLTSEEIDALIRILAGYAGYPRATVAMEIFQKLLSAEGREHG